MKNREIIQGDCRDILRTMDDCSVDVSFTSPPYNRIINDKYDHYDDTLEDYYQFLVDVTDQLLRVSRGNVIVNVQQQAFNKSEVFRYIGHYHDKIAGIIIWTKSNAHPGTNWDGETRSITNAYEYFFVFTKDLKFRVYGNEATMNYIHTSANSEHFEGHGAVMNYKVARWFIEKFTKRGDFVLDPFMGMGTTAMACESLGREWGGCELSPIYIENAYKRLNEVQIEMML